MASFSAAVAVSLLLICAGAALTLGLSRYLRLTRRLTLLMLGSYAVRVGVAVGLHLISAWHLPILRDLQLEDGFWTISQDARAYHWLGVEVAERFTWGTELPSFLYYGDPDFFLLVGAVYRVIGSHPLYVPLINAALGSVLVSLAYLLGCRLNGERAGAAALLLVALWPSAYIWSSQVMKDPLVWCLALLLLLLIVVTFERGDRYGRCALTWVVASPVVFTLVRFRSYLVLLAIMAVLAVVALRLVVPGGAGRMRTATAGMVLAVAFVGMFVFSRAVDMVALATPADPGAGHLRKASYLDSIGDRDQAEWERLRSSGAVPSWPIDATADELHRYRVTRPGPSEYTALFGEGRDPAAQRALIAIHAFKSGETVADEAARQKAEAIRAARIAAGEEQPASSGGLLDFRYGWSLFAKNLSTSSLATLQRGFTRTFEGGALQSGTLTTHVGDITSVPGFLAAIPLGLANALWAPFPWQWLGGSGETGAFRQVAGLEVLLVLLLTPWLGRGVIRGFRTNREAAWLVILFVGGAAAVMGVTVASIGILFRLRLQFLFPLLVVLAAYELADRKWTRAIADAAPVQL